VNRTEFFLGVTAMLPLLLGVIPFGLVFGVLGVASGLTETQTIFMSSIIFAGASQVVFAQLWAAGSAYLIIGSSVALINLRHVLYSVAVSEHLKKLSFKWRVILAYLLTDEAFAVSIQRFNTYGGSRPVHFFMFGAGSTLWIAWQISTVVGVIAGSTIPENWELAFAIPLTFIAVVVPLLKNFSTIICALTSSLIAICGQSLPWNSWILVAAFGGILLGALIEKWNYSR
jgi:4-azaleucine resistance transporter AzlC